MVIGGSFEHHGAGELGRRGEARDSYQFLY